MKKVFLVFAVALLELCVSSCSKSDDSSNVDISPKTMIVGESINVEGMDNPVSENQFVAKTNGSSVIASHVGITNVKKGSYIKKITVLGRQVGYKDPITNWGESSAYVKNECGNMVMKSDKKISSNLYYDRIIIYQNVGEYSLLGYIFKNDRLVAAQTYTSYTNEKTFAYYIKERYAFYKQIAGDYFVGIDALNYDDCKTVVTLEVTNDLELQTTYYEKNTFDN